MKNDRWLYYTQQYKVNPAAGHGSDNIKKYKMVNHNFGDLLT